MIKNILLALLTAICLTACTTVIDQKNAIQPAEAVLERGQSLYIALPDDGAYGLHSFPGTGAEMANYLKMASSQYASKTKVATSVEPVEKALISAKADGAKYLFYLVIANWEPRVAAWSGRPTRVSFKLSVYDVETSQRLMLKYIEVRGRSMTMVSQSANKLAKEAMEQFCDAVFKH